jgi:spermidine/putrescine-binding protein
MIPNEAAITLSDMNAEEQAPPSDMVQSRLTRRRLIGGAAALGLGAAGGAWWRRSRSGAQDGDGETRTLRLLCWPGYDDAEVTRPFREQHNVAIVADYIGANDEIFTWLRAGGIGEYDVVSPHNGIVKPLAEVGLIQPLNPDLVPNAEDLFPRFQWPDWVTLGGEVYGAPFLWGTSPMVYASKHVANAPAAWLDIQSTKFKKRVVMTQDGFGHFLIWNAVLGADDPTRVTVSDLNATADLLISIKKTQSAAFVNTMNDVARVLASGSAWVSTIGWESTPNLGPAKGADLRITHPRPGDYSFCDNLSLVKDAPNPDLAHAFIDHMLAPESQAQLMNRLLRGTVSTGAVASLSTEARAPYAYDDLEKVFTLSPLRGFPPFENACDGISTYVDWVKSWERVRYS